MAYTNAGAGSIADLLSQARPPFQKVVQETDRAAGIVVADHDYFDNLLNTLPDTYQALARQGMYGDFFSFYLCDVVLKLNGKGRPAGVRQGGRPEHGEVHTEMKSFSERNPVLIGAIGVAIVAAIVLGALNYQKLPFFNQGTRLLGLLRRGRRAVHRRRRPGLRLSGRQGVRASNWTAHRCW